MTGVSPQMTYEEASMLCRVQACAADRWSILKTQCVWSLVCQQTWPTFICRKYLVHLPICQCLPISYQFGPKKSSIMTSEINQFLISLRYFFPFLAAGHSQSFSRLFVPSRQCDFSRCRWQSPLTVIAIDGRLDSCVLVPVHVRQSCSTHPVVVTIKSLWLCWI